MYGSITFCVCVCARNAHVSYLSLCLYVHVIGEKGVLDEYNIWVRDMYVML